MRNIYLMIIYFSLAFFSCKKDDELKKPTHVRFKMDLSYSSALDGKLSFNKGYVILDEFKFDGNREQGGDIYFTKQFPEGETISFDTNIEDLDFDIPQGIYNKISIAFNLYEVIEDDNGEDPDQDDEESEEAKKIKNRFRSSKLDDNKGNIVIEGTYLNREGKTYPVRFEFSSLMWFNIVIEDDKGSNTIVLNKDIPSIIEIILDPAYWFDTISTQMLDKAEIDKEDNTLIINEKENTDLYYIVSNRIGESTKAILKN